MEAVEMVPMEWGGDEGYFDEDDTFEDELDVKTHRPAQFDVHVPEKSISVASQLPDENKTMRSKTSHAIVFDRPAATFKRDPAIDTIIESRKTVLIENAYTRLAQTTSQRIRSSQNARNNSVLARPIANEKHSENDPPSSEQGKRPVLVQLQQFESDTYEDGLNGDFDKVSIASIDKSSVQVYEETCKRLSICPCSTVIRSLYTKQINLANYGLGPRGCAALAVALVRNTSVVSIDLTGNNIGNKGMSHIYQILTENAYIEDYNLSFNKLGTKGIRKLAAAAPYCLQMRTLNISGNDLVPTDISTLLAKFEEHPNLKELNLSHNQLDEEGGICLAKWLSDNNVLLELDASWCSIRLSGARAMAKAIGDNNKLIGLNLSNNSFANDTLPILNESLKRNLVLIELNFEGNHFVSRYDSKIREKPTILINGEESLLFKFLVSAGTNQSLKRFRLGKNHLDKRCLMIMLEALSKIENFSLEELDLIGYTFTSKDVEMIHQYFQNHSKLTYYLGSVRQTIENFSMNLLNLIHRYLHDNHLTLIEMFQNADETTNTMTSVEITFQQFLQGLRKAKIPFPTAQIENIMKYLGRDNSPGTIPYKALELD